MRRRVRQGQESWRLVPLDDIAPAVLLERGGNRIGNADRQPLPVVNFDAPCHVTRDRAGRRWLVDPCLPYRPHLVLFGAGHVGAAVVRALAELPCRITWVDQREEMFPVHHACQCAGGSDRHAGMHRRLRGRPASTFLVLTHSHALDQRLSEHILRRPGSDWFGLIGSKTKRKQFQRRLAERGIAEQRLRDMVCPIGLPGIVGKAPAVIAASVVAQLLQVWEAAERHNGMRRPQVVTRRFRWLQAHNP